MLQSKASLAKDVAPAAQAAYQTVVYCEVPKLAAIRQALDGWPLVVSERTTFYGARELIVKGPAGNRVLLAEHGG
jgi:hypothetical protein